MYDFVEIIHTTGQSQALLPSILANGRTEMYLFIVSGTRWIFQLDITRRYIIILYKVIIRNTLA